MENLSVCNVRTQTDGKSITVTFSYDELNRVTRIDYPNDTDTVYTYDQSGHGAGVGGPL